MIAILFETITPISNNMFICVILIIFDNLENKNKFSCFEIKLYIFLF